MRDDRTLTYERLPRTVRELADTIGLPAARRLIDAYGGTAFYVPRRPTPALEALIGTESAQALVDNYHAGSERLQLPRCVAAMRAVEHQAIVAAYYDGATAFELARAYGVTERWVYALAARSRAAANSGQADLF